MGVAAFTGCVFQQMLLQSRARGSPWAVQGLSLTQSSPCGGKQGSSLGLGPLQATLMLVSTRPSRAALLLPTGHHQGFWGGRAGHWPELEAPG